MADRAHKAPTMLHTSNDIKKIYTIKEHLGQGTTGKVYRCCDRRAKKPTKDCAMKVIDKSQATESQLADIYQEIGLLQTLEHEYIANVREIYEAPSTIFIVMDLAEGGDLRDLTCPLSERAAAVMMQSILQALEHIHSQDIAHRDIKLDNILLSRPIPEDHQFDPDSNPEDLRLLADVKLADFGYACKTSGNDMGRCCGTPYYLAPEILLHGVFEKGGRYGKQVDMWSTGVAAYILLTGHLPFQVRNRRKLYRAIVKEPVNFGDEISASARGFLKGLLDRNPATRLTPTQALEHPWIRTAGAGQTEDLLVNENSTPPTTEDSVVGFSEGGSSGSELSLLWHRKGSCKTGLPFVPELPGAVLDEAHIQQPEGAARNYTITERSGTDAQREQDRAAPPTAWASSRTPSNPNPTGTSTSPLRLPSLPTPGADLGPLRAPVVAFEDPTSPKTPVKFMARAWSTMRSAVRF